MLTVLRKLYRNTLFRLSLLVAMLFVLSSFILLGYVYWATISSEFQRVDRALVAEINELNALFEERGPGALGTEVFLRSASREGLYLVVYGEQVTGNLVGQPVENEMGLQDLLVEDIGLTYRKRRFTYGFREDEDSDFRDRRVRGLQGPLLLGGEIKGQMLVARDVEMTMRTADRVRTAMLTSALISLAMGLIIGLFVSRRFSRRVEDFNRLATDIRAGNLERRAPRNFSEDELDLLAEHLNAMLDHIDTLMKAMRYAGDSIAHDLRSPLTRLRTRLESAAGAIKDQTAQDTLYAAAEDAGQLLSTFDSVLRIARLEAGERRELLVDVDPKPLLDDLAELYEPACEDAGLSFSADIAEGQVVSADRGLLSQAVSNLMENAIKYTPSGGDIVLSLGRDKMGRVVIAITDSGQGIPPLERERVKERFVRLDKSRSLPGSGLGLSLVDAVADLHRAEFVLADGIHSEHGEGLSAKLIFPRRRKGK